MPVNETEIPPEDAPLRPPSLAALCRTFPGAFKRIPTGIPGLDNALGGGPTTSRLVVVGGAPGANKTGLLSRLAYRWASEGVMVNGAKHEVLVTIFATDEPRHGFLSRIGQILGVSRTDLDTEDVSVSGAAWEYVGSEVEKLPNLVIFDPRFEPVTFEEVAEFLSKSANGRRCALLVDSLQSAPFRSDDDGHEGARLKIEARVKAAVNLCAKHGICVIATSELSRAGYRKANNGQTEDLAAFKEASGIEYGADVGILMRKVEAEKGNTVDLVIVKSRLGSTDERIRVTRGPRFTFQEIEAPPPPSPEAKEAARDAEIETRANRVHKVVVQNPGITKSDLRAKLGGNNALNDAATGRAIERGWIRDDRKGAAHHYFPCSSADASPA